MTKEIEIKKASVQWEVELKNYIRVIEVGGCERQNFDFYWYKEKITKEEFKMRCASSICLWLRSPIDFTEA